MNLRLVRTTKTNKSTIGELSIEDSEFLCYTLEDKERANGEKVYGATAIPKGTYNVVIDWSDRFQRRMPHILDVPGFTGIRIHSGNTDKDTCGCVLLGLTKGEDFIGQSKIAFEKLFRLLDGEEDVTINIS